MWPKISIIIVTYNHRQYLDECLASVLASDYPNFDVVVIDNASTDGSADYIERTFPEVNLQRNEGNFGFSRANNQAVQMATGEYLTFLNPDTCVTSDWLRELVLMFRNGEDIGLVTPKILLMTEPGKLNTCGNEVHITGLAFCRGFRQNANTLNTCEEVGSISGAAFMINKALFEKLGGFDDNFFTYVEDTDLSWRACLAGFKCMYVPGSVVYHDYQLRFGPRKTYYQERNRYMMLLKNLQWWTLFIMLPVFFSGEVVTWGFTLLRDRQNFRNKFLAYWWIIRNWSNILEARKRSQALRQVRDKKLLQQCGHKLAFEQAAGGIIVTLAHCLFDPLFWMLKKICLRFI